MASLELTERQLYGVLLNIMGISPLKKSSRIKECQAYSRANQTIQCQEASPAEQKEGTAG